MISWPLTLGHFVPQKSPNRAKSSNSFHWKLKGDRVLILTDLDSSMAKFFLNIFTVFDFGHLQVVNGVKVGPKIRTLCMSYLCKNWSFSKCFTWYLYNYETYLWSKFQLNLTLFTGVVAPQKTQNGISWTNNSKCFFRVKLRTANTRKLELGIQQL